MAFIRSRERREHLLPAALAAACTGFTLFLFYLDPKINTYTYVPQEVIYVENWRLDRTEEEILKDRWQIQCLKDKNEAKRREAVKTLGRMSGMDVDEIEREAAEKRRARGEVEIKRPPGITC